MWTNRDECGLIDTDVAAGNVSKLPLNTRYILDCDPRALFSPIFMQRSYLFRASGLDNQFPVGRKDLGDSSYTSRVTAVFFSKFIVMATGVGRDRICLTSFSSTTPKNLY